MNEDRGLEKAQGLDERIKERIANLTHYATTVHRIIIGEFGGAKGMRDRSALESAIAAPFATFAGEHLHLTVFDRAAALMRSISLNHPFNDGNKRSSLVVTATFLFEHGIGFKDEVSDDQMVDFSISVAEGKLHVKDIARWLEDNTNGASARSFRQVMEQLASN